MTIYYNSCVSRCCRCLRSVPSPSMTTWIFFTVAVGSCGGSLMVAAIRTRELLNSNHPYTDFADPVCLGVLFGMVFLGVIFVIVGTLSSYPMNSMVFDSAAKNVCARAINVTMVLVVLMLQLAWLFISILLTVPVALLLLLMYLVKFLQVTSINLKSYGLSDGDYILAGDELQHFYDESHGVFVCYAIAFIASIIVVICLTCFAMCASANIAHLQENHLGMMDISKHNNVAASKNSVVDTRM